MSRQNSLGSNKTSCRTSKTYQLETDSLGSNPVLRRSKDNEEVRPLSANRNTIKALEQRGLISPAKGRDPLTMVWRLSKK